MGEPINDILEIYIGFPRYNLILLILQKILKIKNEIKFRKYVETKFSKNVTNKNQADILL